MKKPNNLNRVLKITLLLFFYSWTFAQTEKIEKLDKELQILLNAGDSSLNYAQKLIEMGEAYYEIKNEEKAESYFTNGKKILDEKAAFLPDSEDERRKAKEIINNGYLTITFVQWHFLIQKNEYTKAESLLKERAWVNLCINIQQFSKILELFKILAMDSGTESATFLNHWSLVYGKLANLKDLESLWQFLIEKRINEFGENSEGHISALFGLSNCYKRLEENNKYAALKKKVESKWANAYSQTVMETTAPETKAKSQDKADEKIEENPKGKKQNTPKSGAKPKSHNNSKMSEIGKEISKEEAKDTTNPIYTLVEVMPRFPGCEFHTGDDMEKKKCADQRLLNFIYKNIAYPDKARENGVEGMAVVSFTVTEHGTIINFEILRDPGSGCGKEVVRIMNLMNELPSRWKSGMQKGKHVRVKYNLPVNFKLS